MSGSGRFRSNSDKLNRFPRRSPTQTLRRSSYLARVEMATHVPLSPAGVSHEFTR